MNDRVRCGRIIKLLSLLLFKRPTPNYNHNNIINIIELHPIAAAVVRDCAAVEHAWAENRVYTEIKHYRAS